MKNKRLKGIKDDDVLNVATIVNTEKPLLFLVGEVKKES